MRILKGPDLTQLDIPAMPASLVQLSELLQLSAGFYTGLIDAPNGFDAIAQVVAERYTFEIVGFRKVARGFGFA